MNNDEKYMLRALQLAALGGVSVAPNPMVGCVIVYNDQIIGEGYHKKFGEAHAEVNAVASVADKSLLAQATIYVTLEPCAHQGKTPPCANLIIKHHFKRAVIATVDPFSLVAGKGIELLKEAGIETVVGVKEQEAQQLNKRFFSFHQKKRPYIILKWAQTLDGFIDAPRLNDAQEIRWISNPRTQLLTHQWRSEEQAILVGWKTIQNDNPSLTTRAFYGQDPIRIIIDKELNAPTNAVVFNDGKRTIVFNSLKTETTNAVSYIQLRDFNLENIFAACVSLGIASIIIEGGKHTIDSLIAASYWDEARVIVGNKTFNAGLKAPELNSKSTYSMQLGPDHIHFYHNS
ncbi:MAG: bifunctional diaminohydroxyphosphoribosylaminopyrimidine deaminase/5-amino-6-(5-phosphoribosylamino)uracil reductase RibD [Moraxellaceae bacterium]